MLGPKLRALARFIFCFRRRPRKTEPAAVFGMISRSGRGNHKVAIIATHTVPSTALAAHGWISKQSPIAPG